MFCFCFFLSELTGLSGVEEPGAWSALHTGPHATSLFPATGGAIPWSRAFWQRLGASFGTGEMNPGTKASAW